MNIEAAVQAATARVVASINRSAGQHSRAMRSHTAITEADLYAMGMESDTAYRLMPQLCALAGIAYPPKQI